MNGKTNENTTDSRETKMLVLNNVRNKMVLRLATVIKNNKPYQKIAAFPFSINLKSYLEKS